MKIEDFNEKLHKACVDAINGMGINEFRKTSMFMSSIRQVDGPEANRDYVLLEETIWDFPVEYWAK